MCKPQLNKCATCAFRNIKNKVLLLPAHAGTLGKNVMSVVAPYKNLSSDIPSKRAARSSPNAGEYDRPLAKQYDTDVDAMIPCCNPSKSCSCFERSSHGCAFLQVDVEMHCSPFIPLFAVQSGRPYVFHVLG